MNTDQYLERIEFTARPSTPDYITLETLVENHLLNIPFENIDIQSKVPIHLSIGRFFEKVVLNKRGGYCYELNGLFYELLGSLGYEVSMISGRVAAGGRGYGAEFDHMALMVNIDGLHWLVDVGFGDFSMRPLAMLVNDLQSDGRTHFRIVDNIQVDGTPYYGVEKLNAQTGTFSVQYIFTTTARQLSHFEEMNGYQQTSPDSHFTRSYMCSLPTRNGRMSIVNNKLHQTVDGRKTFKRIRNEEHRRELLQKHFGIGNVYEMASF